MVGGELKGHMRAPGVSHDQWPRDAERDNHPGEVAGDRRKVVAGVGLVRHAVAALVESDEAEVGCQQRRKQIPDPRVRGQAVNQQDRGWHVRPAPVAQVEA